MLSSAGLTYPLEPTGSVVIQWNSLHFWLQPLRPRQRPLHGESEPIIVRDCCRAAPRRSAWPPIASHATFLDSRSSVPIRRPAKGFQAYPQTVGGGDCYLSLAVVDPCREDCVTKGSQRGRQLQ